MALVFQAAGDETERGDQRGPFIFGGWVAPVTDWMGEFSEAWQDRVLNGRPVLPHLHVSELLSPRGRAKYGISRRQAERRIENAISVIRAFPSLTPISTAVDGGHFRDAFKGTAFIRSTKQPATFDAKPDYMTFQGFAVGALYYVAERHPEAEQVDFLIEKNGKITEYLENEFFAPLGKLLRERELGHLAKLIGAFIRGDKKRVPLQAADLLLWYTRIAKGDSPTPQERRRFRRLVEGREGVENSLPNDFITDLDTRSRARHIPSPFKPKPKRKIGGGAA